MNSSRAYDLICFDVDGTLVRHPTDKVIWEILNLRFTGSDAINVERYRLYKAGELSYAGWVELDVQGWIDAGATKEEVERAVREFELYPGVMDTLEQLRQHGIHMAVISGTLDVVIDVLIPTHPFDDVFSNKLLFDDGGKLCGWEATPFDLQGKPEALRKLAEKHGVELSRTLFVGDGENDVPIIGVAGAVVAFQPRSRELERGADYVINNGDMRSLLEILR